MINELAFDSDSWFKTALEKFSINEKGVCPDLFGKCLNTWSEKNIKKHVRVLSLFSGGGGLDIGFHDCGFEIVECNELESKFCETLLENSKKGGYLEGTNVVCCDINDYDPIVKDIDFIIGGPPCQTFSAAGARAAGVNGTEDDRGNLFLQYARILDRVSPKGFLFENVYRLLGAQSGEAWKSIKKEFEARGYRLHWKIIDSSDYGVPQFRERLFIVGLKEGEYRFPYPTHGPDSADRRPYYTAGDALRYLRTTKTSEDLGGRHGHLLNDIPPGLNLVYTEHGSSKSTFWMAFKIFRLFIQSRPKYASKDN